MKQLAARLALALAFAATLASAAEPTDKDAVAMVQRGAAFMKANGKEALMQKIGAKDPAFLQGALYIDMRDLATGKVLAHPVNPSIVGKDLVNVPDPSGKLYRKEIVELAKKDGKGWVDYLYKNPETGRIEPKTTYIERVNDVVLEAGIYRK